MEEYSYHASFDENGMPLAYYRSDMWPEPPSGTVEITEAQWRELNDHGGSRRWDGTDVVIYDPPAPEPEPVTVVFKAQAKLALLEAGLLDDVETALASLEGIEGQRARIEWNDRTEFHRDHEFIALLASELSLTAAQVDALFERASQL